MLRRVRRASDTELAQLLYRAPSELLGGLSRETGSRLCALLRETGIDVDLLQPEETFEPGSGDFEVALVVTRVENLLAVIKETVRVLGVDVETAKRLVCGSPAVLIGRISQATVDALRRRYQALDVELDVSCSASAEFDLAAQSGDDTTRRHVERYLSDEGIAATKGEDGQVLATGLTLAAAERLWAKLTTVDAKVRILNRSFHRFDIRLDRAPGRDDSRRPELAAWLVSTIGMPAATAERALDHAPVVLKENVAGAEMASLLAGVHERGGVASAVLLALQGFGLLVKPGGDRQSARSRIETITGGPPPAGFDQGGPTTLDGPFTKTQARWLQHELRRVGVASVLAER